MWTGSTKLICKSYTTVKNINNTFFTLLGSTPNLMLKVDYIHQLKAMFCCNNLQPSFYIRAMLCIKAFAEKVVVLIFFNTFTKFSLSRACLHRGILARLQYKPPQLVSVATITADIFSIFETVLECCVKGYVVRLSS